MAIKEMSSEPVVDTYLDPDIRTTTLNEDWEAGPVAVGDTSQGRQNQAWHLTFAAGTFTITPETTGSPVVVLTGQDSVQCSFTFDQNGRPSITWIDSLGQGYLYWYDTAGAGDYVITAFENSPVSVALTMDDKRSRQIAACDMQLYYTKLVSPGVHALYCRYQRDRFDTEYERENPCWPYIHKCGMHEGLRVQLSTSTEAP